VTRRAALILLSASLQSVACPPPFTVREVPAQSVAGVVIRGATLPVWETESSTDCGRWTEANEEDAAATGGDRSAADRSTRDSAVAGGSSLDRSTRDRAVAGAASLDRFTRDGGATGNAGAAADPVTRLDAAGSPAPEAPAGAPKPR